MYTLYSSLHDVTAANRKKNAIQFLERQILNTVEPLITDTSAIRTPLQYEHLYNTDSSLGPWKMPIHSL